MNKQIAVAVISCFLFVHFAAEGRVVHCNGGEAVTGFGGPFDVSVSDESLEGGADGRVSHRGAFSDLSLRERLLGFGEYLDDTLLSGLRCRHGLDRSLPAQAQGGPLTVVAAIRSSDPTHTRGARLGFTSMIRNESLRSSYAPSGEM